MIDWQQVNALCDDIGAVEFTEVVDLFLVEVDSAIENLTNRPEPLTEQEMHALKGNALNLGFQDFAGVCRASETLCTQGRPDLVDLARLVQAYQSERREFLTGLPFNLSGQTDV